MRKCVGCGEMKSKKEMIRVLKTSEEEFLLDATGKKMDAAHIFAIQKNVSKKLLKIKA
jgi:predicted RNA-binding protein YlxR (DUF448 family)